MRSVRPAWFGCDEDTYPVCGDEPGIDGGVGSGYGPSHGREELCYGGGTPMKMVTQPVLDEGGTDVVHMDEAGADVVHMDVWTSFWFLCTAVCIIS